MNGRDFLRLYPQTERNYDTGGNCTTWRIALPEGREALLIDADTEVAPDADETVGVVVGVYGPDAIAADTLGDMLPASWEQAIEFMARYVYPEPTRGALNAALAAAGNWLCDAGYSGLFDHESECANDPQRADEARGMVDHWQARCGLPEALADAITYGLERIEPMKFLFDVKLFAAVRINAANEAEARRKLQAVLDCATVNAGELDGEPVLFEVSLDDNEDQNAELVEIES